MKIDPLERLEVDKTEGLDKDKKKKSRSRRRIKQDGSPSEIYAEAAKGVENGESNNHEITSLKQRELEIGPSEDDAVVTVNHAYCPISPMHVNGHKNSENNRSLQNHTKGRSDPGGNPVWRPCSEAITTQVSSNSYTNKDSPCHNHVDHTKIRHFTPHWSIDAVNAALEKGEIFKAYFRVNAHNRLEAYCSIDGVQTDVLISGIHLQNRAVEGDIVAVKIDPLSYWTKMKGSFASGINSVPLPVEGSSECNGIASTGSKGKSKVESNGFCEHGNLDSSFISQKEVLCGHVSSIDRPSNRQHVHDHHPSQIGSTTNAVEELCATIGSFPSKRPTGRVLAVIEKSSRRDAVVGFLDVKKFVTQRERSKKDAKKNKGTLSFSDHEWIQMTSNDPRFPKMIVVLKDLPDCIKRRFENGDETLESELFGARIVSWSDESILPQACISHTFGQGGVLESQICAVLFENSICSSEFGPECFASIPHHPWKVPHEELKSRKDLRNLCVFTIDPSSATDLDDALSVERLSNGAFRVGVHIADVSYFVLPDTELDKEARIRSTSVYMARKKLPMLPPLLSENVGSLVAGADKLTLSMFFDINLAGDVVDRSISRTVIRSCCKLSYKQAQEIIDGPSGTESSVISGNDRPLLHGRFEWLNVVNSIKELHKLSKILRAKRFDGGALYLERSKIEFLFDVCGNPCGSRFRQLSESNFIVEEFMLLTNQTAAEVISNAFPESALLRRHPNPKLRKLREFESFCNKHGFELDTSSSGQFHLSIQKMKEKLKDDTSLCDILIKYAARPLQPAAYFCTKDFKDDESEWGHYSLCVPLYTHFTSPLRRYPDLIVHRTLAAVLEAEEALLKRPVASSRKSRRGLEPAVVKCFTGAVFAKGVAESPKGRDALAAAAIKHGVPGSESLAEAAVHCNDRKLAGRYVNEACNKLYMWSLLKRKKVLFSEARVLGLGPKFMTIYIQKFAIERRINYDEVDELTVEWLEATSSVVLSRRPARRGSPGKWRPIEEVALIVTLCDPQPDDPSVSSENEIEPPVFPLTLRLLSTIHVALHATGGHNGPVDIGARLYMSSYFC